MKLVVFSTTPEIWMGYGIRKAALRLLTVRFLLWPGRTIVLLPFVGRVRPGHIPQRATNVDFEKTRHDYH